MTRSAHPGTREAVSSTSSSSAATAHLSTKGGGVPARDDGNLLREDLSLPAAVIYRSRLLNNLHWMQRFADSRYVILAPHGKTTMTPALFQLQLQAGAWGLTLATAPQVAAAYASGVRRVLMANQLIGRRNMAIISELLSADAETPFEFYCLVDSAEQAHQLGRFFDATGQSLQLLLEVGVPGGRCGCR